MLSHFLIIGNGATRALISLRSALISTVKSRLFSNIYSETKLRTSVLLQGAGGVRTMKGLSSIPLCGLVKEMKAKLRKLLTDSIRLFSSKRKRKWRTNLRVFD